MSLLFAMLFSAAEPRPLIVDTDAGSDDLLAISFLLTRPEVNIEAITVVGGVAHVHPGAMNILRLLQAAGKRNIPVYEGPSGTPPGGRDFPSEWRQAGDQMAGVDLPQTSRRPETLTAADFLAARLHKPATILALGPLTNIAAAGASSLTNLVIMGGAVRVPGNVDASPAAEWNIYADPLAAQRVFNSGARILLIPLDATNHVPVGMPYLEMFRGRVKTPLGKLAAQILATSQALIDRHIFYAWDPLAAVALLHPDVISTEPLRLAIDPDGRTREVPAAPPNVNTALDARPARFQEIFLGAFSHAR